MLPYEANLGTNIAEFEAAIAAEAASTVGEIPKYLREVALDAVTQFIATTPVDTGHAKANWQVGVDIKPTDELEAFDPSPRGVSDGPTLDKAKLVLNGVSLQTTVIWIVNNVDYIGRIVEDGHSLQTAPGEFSAVLQRLEATWT